MVMAVGTISANSTGMNICSILFRRVMSNLSNSGPSCDDSLYLHDVFSYPGGNLQVGVADGMGCFYCD
jgi:hypothetical protein